MRAKGAEENQLLQASAENAGEFGKKIGLFGALFGCWHSNLSRPFTHGKHSYRVCLQCGARRHFDAETFTTHGSFYYPPTPSRGI